MTQINKREHWVLLRGLMREQRHWGAFPATLARALPGAAILTPDLPGNGTRHAQDITDCP